MSGTPFAVRLARDAVMVSGPDAVDFLQGQLSQDVAALAVGAGAWTLLLEPDGKLGFWLRVSRTAPDGFVLDVDGGFGAPMRARLERFKLRVDVVIEPLDWSCVAVRGGDIAPAGDGAALSLPVRWGPMQGVDLLGPAPMVPGGIPEVHLEVYEATRIAAGFPRMGAELDAGRIAAEAGVVEASVSFTKGCYTGQELVARIDSRGGHVPRHLRLVVVDAPSVPTAGAEVVVDGEVVGEITSAAAALDHGVALAYVKRAVVPPVDAVVRTADGETGARVEVLPPVS